MVDGELAARLRALADEYEVSGFLEADPAGFMHRFDDPHDVEVAAFVAANLAFGRRDQILAHVDSIMSASGGHPYAWVMDGAYRAMFPDSPESFYRVYTKRDMLLFFDTLRDILMRADTLGDFFRAEWEGGRSDVRSPLTGAPLLAPLIASHFPKDCGLVSHSPKGAAKKLNMMLRWLVRTGSPVDIGIWPWYGARNLLMPLDVHVMRQATVLGLIPPGPDGRPCSANLAVAARLTGVMAEVFGADDPVRGDFALFGVGVGG